MQLRSKSRLALCAAVVAAALVVGGHDASAETITFDHTPPVTPIPPDDPLITPAGWETAYDTAAVDVDFVGNYYFWDTGYNDLTNVAYGTYGGTLIIDFIANPGYEVTLESFDLGNYLDFGDTTQFHVYDLADLVTPLSSSTGITVDYSTTSHSSFTVGLSSTVGLRLQLGPDLYNIGIDNIEFSSTAVPEPGTLALAGLGIAALGWRRRRRATT